MCYYLISMHKTCYDGQYDVVHEIIGILIFNILL